MADSFQPRFVDLVRNYTSTSGTGNLVLDEAPPGFTSFTDALQPGDRFYYSVAGLENTSEAEVGRGTLQPDGSIAREPIGGTPTSFSTGRKTVALVTAAEWFETVDAVRGAPASANSRTELAGLPAQGAALLSEAGREGLFLFDPGDLSERIAADIAQGLFVAPASDPTGASGAWARQFDGPINPSWFGIVEGDAAGANGAANSAAWAAMMGGLKALNKSGNWQSLPSVRFGPGTFEFSSTIELTRGAVVISGEGMGHGSNPIGAATRLKFRDCTGIRIQNDDTSGAANKDAATHVAGNYSCLRDLGIEGNFSGTEAEYHGVHARGTFHAQNVNVRNFAGDGFHIEADYATIGGNACGYTLINCTAWHCRNGIKDDGDNTSGSTILGGIYNQNRQWGLWQSNFLGTSHTSLQFDYNGVTPYNDGIGIGASIVSHGGNLYGAIAGQEAGASTNAPSGTTADNSWWYYISAGPPETGKPAWSSGIFVRAGGCVRDDNVTSRNVFTACYAEQNQGKAQICQRSIVLGGMLAVWCRQDGAAQQGTAIIDSEDGAIVTRTAFEALSGSVQARLGDTRGNPSAAVWRAIHPTHAPGSWYLQFSPSGATGDLRLSYQGISTQVAYWVSGPVTTSQFGTGGAVPYAFSAPQLMVQDNGKNIANARRLMVDSAPPSSGAHGEGEFVLARDGNANRVGWKCVTAGTPGTWRELFGLAQLQAAGSGLTVSGTDKILGRSSAGSGAVEEISCTAAGRALLSGADSAAQRTSLGLKRGLSFHCAGLPTPSEVIGGGIAPYSMTLSAQNSSCKALVAATAAVTLSIRKNGTDIGSIAFAAAGTAGTVSLTSTSIAAGDQVTIHNAASTDATLADIDGLLSE